MRMLMGREVFRKFKWREWNQKKKKKNLDLRYLNILLNMLFFNILILINIKL